MGVLRARAAGPHAEFICVLYFRDTRFASNSYAGRPMFGCETEPYPMLDLILIVTGIAFFALCEFYTRLCDRL
jgi:hypothetical protein